MPHVTFNTPDLYESVTRPTIVNIIRQIIMATGMPPETFIEYTGEAGTTVTHGSFMDSRDFTKDQYDNHLNKHSALFPFSNKVIVSANETIEEETLLNSAIYYQDQIPIFKNDPLQIYLYPNYEKVNVELNFEYRTKDKNEAVQWRSDMRRRIRIKYIDESFTTHYEYPINMVAIAFLRQFYDMQEAVAGYGESFTDFLTKGLIKNWKVLVGQGGAKGDALLGISQTQLDVLGNFDFGGEIPKEERDDKGTVYSINFTYRFKYDRPFATSLSYPLVIHNQLVPMKYRPDKMHYDPAPINTGIGSRSTTIYNRLLSRSYGQSFRLREHMRLVPWYDEFLPNMMPYCNTPLFQMMIAIKDKDPTLITKIDSLEEMGGYQFSEPLMRYIREQKDNMLLSRAAGLWFALYRDQAQITHEHLYINDDLEVRTREPMHLRERYHFCIGVNNDLLGMAKFAQCYLQDNPDIFIALLEFLDPAIIEQGLGPKILRDKYIPDSEFRRVCLLIKSTNEHHRKERIVFRQTVLCGNLRLVNKENK